MSDSDNAERGERSERDHREIVHDLRMRVLSGEDIDAEEMLLIVEDIRRGRRSAGAPPSRAKKGTGTGAKKGAKGAGAAAGGSPVDLGSILDQDI